MCYVDEKEDLPLTGFHVKPDIKDNVLYAEQDGNYFYACQDVRFFDFDFPDEKLLKPIIRQLAPFKVKDYDMEAAKKARKWFIDLMAKEGFTKVVFD